MTGRWAATGLLVLATGLGACGIKADGSVHEVDQGLGSQDASGDVTLGVLGATEYGAPEVNVMITNTSAKRSDYMVDVVLERDSEQIDTGTAFTENLEPGQRAVEEAIFFDGVGKDIDGATVRVATVSRTAS